MFCAKCGVQLADSEKKCPLCGTEAYHPDIPRTPAPSPYPMNSALPTAVNPKGLLFLITIFLAIPIPITVLLDLQLHSAITWSAYATGGILLGYILFILPFWFKKRNPVIFLPIDFVSAGLYLLYISITTNGGWFLSFAFPVLGMVTLLVCSNITLFRYLRRGHLYVVGGTWLGLSVFFILLEFFINLTFHKDFPSPWKLVWSYYPSVSCVLIGAALTVIAICRPWRESLRKRFFV